MGSMMLTGEDGETEGTDEPVCPHCGHEMTDAGELGLEDGDKTTTECDSCEAPMVVTGHVWYTYSTAKVKP